MQPAGNYYDKYHTKNPIARHLMNGFFGAFDQLLSKVATPSDVLEAGCGEGELSIRVARATGAVVRAFDIGPEVVEEARGRAARSGVAENISFSTGSIYALSAQDSADLVVCCEVLEHLEDPDKALDRLADTCRGHLIASVPREPLWRILNMTRGKYLGQLGNTPGHLQHWSTSKFSSFIQRRFEIVEMRRPLPWTMVLCRPKQG